MNLVNLDVNRIAVSSRFRKDVGSTISLQKSISEIGLLHPLVLNSRFELVAGFRRLTVVKQLGWSEVPCVIVSTLDDALAALKAELGENTCRLNMDPTEIYELGKAIEAIEKPDAKRRQAQAGPTSGKGKKASGSGKLPEAVPGDTRDKVASSLGISGRTYEKIKQVAEAAEKEPDKFGDLPAKMDQQSVDAAFKEMKGRIAEREVESDSTPRTQSLIPCEPCEPQPPAWKQTLDLALSQLCDTFDALPGPPDEIADALEEAANRLLTQAATLRSGR